METVEYHLPIPRRGGTPQRRHRPGTLPAWILRLSDQGYFVSRHSTAVPVQLWGLLPEGPGFQFRCGGVHITLSLFDRARARWEVRLFDPQWTPETTVHIWERRQIDARPAPPRGANLVFTDSAHPDVRVVLDGDVAYRWTWCEAGRLSVRDAAAWFDRMLPPARHLAHRAGLSTSAGEKAAPAVPVAHTRLASCIGRE